MPLAYPGTKSLFALKHCAIVFVATGTTHKQALYFYMHTYIHYKYVVLKHVKRKSQLYQMATASTAFESMIDEYPDNKDFEFLLKDYCVY